MEYLEHGHEEPEEEKFNFYLPEELMEIYRVQNKTGEVEELGGRSVICWEDVKSLKEYAWEDDWVKFPGPKYYITLHGSAGEALILGNYEEMKTKWIKFRERHMRFNDNEM